MAFLQLLVVILISGSVTVVESLSKDDSLFRNCRDKPEELQKKCFKIGVFGSNVKGPQDISLKLNESLAAVQYAIDKYLPQYLPGYIAEAEIAETKCDLMVGPFLATSFLIAKIHIFVGPVCNTVISWIANLAKHYAIPVWTIGAQTSITRDQFNTLARFGPLYSYMNTDEQIGLYEAILRVREHFDWPAQMMMVHRDTSSSSNNKYNDIYFAMANSVNFKFNRVPIDNGQIYMDPVEFYDEDDASSIIDFTEPIRRIQEKARLVIVSCEMEYFHQLLLQMDDRGLLESGEYVFIQLQYWHTATDFHRPWLVDGDEETTRRLKNMWRQVFTLRPKTLLNNDTAVVDSFREEFLEYCDKVPGCNATEDNWDDVHLQFAASTVDMLHIYWRMISDDLTRNNSTIEELPIEPLMAQHIANTTYTDMLSGTIHLSGERDRVAGVDVYYTDFFNDRLSLLASLPAVLHQSQVSTIYWEDHNVPWIKGSVPNIPPECGYGPCPKPESRMQFFITLGTIILSLLIIISLVGGFLIYRKVKMEEALMRMAWKIKHEHLEFPKEDSPTPVEENGTGDQYRSNVGLVPPDKLSKRRKESLFSYSRSETRDRIISKRAGSMDNTNSIYLKDESTMLPYVYPLYRGVKVAARPLKDTTVFELTRKRLIELEKLKGLNNEHIVKFYGATVENPRYLVYEYCPKGNLSTFLYSPDMKADLSFRFSLMLDIARGLHFLFNNQLFHGRLSTAMCLLDNRFVCKISDFGLYYLRPLPQVNMERTDDDYFKRYLYVAPERLRPKKTEAKLADHELHHMQRCDIYSYSIIVHEILFYNGAFFIFDQLSRAQIVQEVIKGGASPLRPVFIDSQFTDELTTLEPGQQEVMRNRIKIVQNVMEQCWSENPNDRYEISTVISKFKELVPDNIMENMLQRMDKYAKTMESLVEEKAKSVVNEKKRADDLLYSILPVKIANQILAGKIVEPEWYDDSTIYFSDIVGFTALSSSSTPNQVVELLNSLYTLFDAVIEDFDVYKVETIGDAYMVVSGIPTRNGTRHSYHIASMSLKLLEEVKKFTIPHRRDEKIKLRIGLHTGPACAGVVGTKMPRYCLFGDTVNTASRMESNGEPLKIHISEPCKLSLDSFNEFNIEYRGEIPMKGKGVQRTYWLLSKKTEHNPSLSDIRHRPQRPSLVNQPTLHYPSNGGGPDSSRPRQDSSLDDSVFLTPGKELGNNPPPPAAPAPPVNNNKLRLFYPGGKHKKNAAALASLENGLSLAAKRKSAPSLEKRQFDDEILTEEAANSSIC